MQLREQITRTIDGTQYTVDHGTISLIASKRERGRGMSPRDRVMIFTDLRRTVAERMGIDIRTAHWLLDSIKYAQLFR